MVSMALCLENKGDLLGFANSPQPTRVRRKDMNFWNLITQSDQATLKGKRITHRLIFIVLISVIILVALNACNRLPNPVEKKNGYSWIPIQDTAFLVQDKTWLKGYSRNSTDGLVYSFTLHAIAPIIQPWNPKINNAMYPPLGRGAAVIINVTSNDYSDFSEIFSRFPQSRWGGG